MTVRPAAAKPPNADPRQGDDMSNGIVKGDVGWSNTRGGLEFYAEQPDGAIGRFIKDQPEGDLLAYHLEEEGIHEGAHIFVVAANRFERYEVHGEAFDGGRRWTVTVYDRQETT